MSEQANKPLLDEIASSSAWFRAKKTKPLWAQKLDQDGSVKSLEGTQPVKAGDYLCRGPAGDVWPQQASRLESKYRATGSVDAEGWQRFEPLADAEGVMAAKVDHPFEVTGPFGRLNGNPGDYVVKDYSDRDVPYPADVWIVAQGIFQATYEQVAS